MSDSKGSYSLSDKVNQIQGKIGTTNVLNNFIGNDFASKLRSKNNKDDQNLLKVLSDLLVSLVGS